MHTAAEAWSAGACAAAPGTAAADAGSARSVGTVLAFDFGAKRIGVAVGEASLAIAHALTVIRDERNDLRFGQIDRLVAEWRPDLLVVGLPLAVDGGEHAMTARCRRFARQLQARFGLAVCLVDERYTSVAAEGLVRASRGAAPREKGQIDAAAAQLILQSYFDTPRHS